jgi:hypothetical protein
MLLIVIPYKRRLIFMKIKKIFFLLLFTIFIIGNINAHSIVDRIKIFYDRYFLTFQKEDNILTVNLNHLLTRSVIYQYINSYYNNGYYYFIIFAKSWWKDTPTSSGEYGAGTIETAFIIKINEEFNKYELINQYIANFDPQEYMMGYDTIKKNGTIFYWFIMGHYRGDNGSELFKIVSIDVSKLESGFIVNDYQNIKIIQDIWFNNIIGEEIKYDNEDYIFNWKLE